MTAKRKETGAAYLRVGTTIYKRVQQPLSSGRSIEILLAWNVETLRQDFGSDMFSALMYSDDPDRLRRLVNYWFGMGGDA